MGSRLRGRKISIAVADEAFRATLGRTLERESALTSGSSAGLELLEDLARFHPDICIVDVDLPDSGAEDLVREIRSRVPGLPVILVSAHLLPGDAATLQSLPTLPLPFSRVQLIDLLERQLGGRAA